MFKYDDVLFEVPAGTQVNLIDGILCINAVKAKIVKKEIAFDSIPNPGKKHGSCAADVRKFFPELGSVAVIWAHTAGTIRGAMAKEGYGAEYLGQEKTEDGTLGFKFKRTEKKDRTKLK